MKASPAGNDNLKAKAPPVCAICGRPRVEKYNPFCSKRCADVDLHRWLSGGYVVPGGEEPDDERREAPGEADD